MGPRITHYDDATGERIELSTVTLANWAAKTANLLRDELGAGPGTRVAVLLPAHWQTAAVFLGVWWIGAEVVLSGGPATSGTADVALCTSDRLDEADDAVAGGEVAVLSLDPFGKPVADLPIGVTDYATAVRVHGDQVVAEQHPGPALAGRTVAEVLSAARDSAAAQGFSSADRVNVDGCLVDARRGRRRPAGGVRRRGVAGSDRRSRPRGPRAAPGNREGDPGPVVHRLRFVHKQGDRRTSGRRSTPSAPRRAAKTSPAPAGSRR